MFPNKMCIKDEKMSEIHIHKISPVMYSQIWVGNWDYNMQAMMTHIIDLAMTLP